MRQIGTGLGHDGTGGGREARVTQGQQGGKFKIMESTPPASVDNFGGGDQEVVESKRCDPKVSQDRITFTRNRLSVFTTRTWTTGFAGRRKI